MEKVVYANAAPITMWPNSARPDGRELRATGRHCSRGAANSIYSIPIRCHGTETSNISSYIASETRHPKKNEINSFPSDENSRANRPVSGGREPDLDIQLVFCPAVRRKKDYVNGPGLYDRD